ncbi:AMP-binding protein [Streptomyces paludis]|uniref:AMP-dependent synthetase n=1 Tax=Streptomyces paludis TaxID=2282738 RepID=A0A345HY29_9ACTN|nr:AMP-binding protein [Streptomyces paludis]AXG81603.1 AMP-dependent synthetase [Streptomyces paludis]
MALSGPRPDPGSAADPLDRVHELVTRYSDPHASVARLLCDGHPADAVAYTVVEPDLSATVLTYGRLKTDSERFAAALAGLGVGPGDRVATLMGKSVDYLVALLAIWRLGAVTVPLFTAFAPPAIALRLLASDTKVVICDAPQRAKLAPGADIPADAAWRVVVSGGTGHTGDLRFADLLDAHAPGHPAVALGGDAPLVHIFTSGTTGRPKGVVVPTAAIAGFRLYAEYGCGVSEDDVFWNAADPGWAYGLYFGVIASLSLGVPSVLLHSGFSAGLTWQVMDTLGVTNFTAAPTVYRSLRASGVPVPAGLALRRASSAGEPLTPEINAWAEEAFGIQVHDHYGQTEAGMLVNNHQLPSLRSPVRPGSMGHPMPGWSLRVLYEDRDEIAPTGTVGRIAADLGASPLAWFKGYEGDPVKSAEKFSPDGRWYYTGDVGRVDEEGYFHFSSRDDDVIIMAGYRIGPFEVESVLVTHPAVVECAVVAAPDEVRGEVLEAYVVLQEGAEASDQLTSELQQLVKTRFAAHAYPRTVHFTDQLPKTPSGKIQRFVLRQQRRTDQANPNGPAHPTNLTNPTAPTAPTDPGTHA